jgi:hypothetical protein
VESAVRRLRHKLGPELLIADRGAGWRLAVPGSAVAPTIDAVAFDPSTRRPRVDGRAEALGEQEATLLSLLLRARGGLVSRADAGSALGLRREGALDALALRRRLGPGRLHTVRGRGWSLAVPEPAPAASAPPGLRLSDLQAIARIGGSRGVAEVAARAAERRVEREPRQERRISGPAERGAPLALEAAEIVAEQRRQRGQVRQRALRGRRGPRPEQLPQRLRPAAIQQPGAERAGLQVGSARRG